MDGIVVIAELGDPNLGLVAVPGDTTLRLPPGNYTAWTSADIDGDRADSKAVAFLAAPETVLDKATTVTLDASKARKVSVRTPKESETRQLRYDMARTAPDGTVQRDAFQIPLTYDQLWASPTKKVTQGSFSFLTRWRQGEELIGLKADGHDVPVTVQNGSALAEDSEQKLTAVYAGNGAAADYQGRGVKGKAVVVTRSDAVPPADRLANALAAGAKALFVVNDGRGVAMESYAPYGEQTTIPVASVQKLAGQTLIKAAQRGKKLSVDQRKYASYVYDLVDRHDGTIPDRSLAFAPAARQLAKVENTFYGHKAALGGGYRYDIPDYGPGLGFEEYEKFPGTRTEWVNPLPGDSFWYENHSVLNADATDTAARDAQRVSWTTRRAAPTAPTGSRRSPRPRLGTGYWGPFRTAYNDLQFNITPWTDSGEGHSGSMPADEYDTTSYAFYQGDTLVKKGAGRAGYAGDLSAEKVPYRLVIDSARDEDTWKTSTRTHSEWGFVSGALPEGTQQADIPLLQLDYDVDTDLAGDVKAGRWTEIGLSSGTQEWLDGAVKAKKASLSVSYDDGKTWSAVELRKAAEGSWTATLQDARQGSHLRLAQGARRGPRRSRRRPGDHQGLRPEVTCPAVRMACC